MPGTELCALFFLVALVYASVGFGGGSSYLALLALAGTDHFLLRSTALLCNITVVLGSVVVFYRAGHLDLRRTLPLVLASVPLAFVGGYVPFPAEAFRRVLGLTLILAAAVMWSAPHLRELDRAAPTPPRSTALGLLAGGAIGLLSGLVGIGGGIFLAPVLYWARWAPPKTIAATASLFILANSAFGLAGQMAAPHFAMDWRFALPLMAAVLAGGQVGVRMSVRHLQPAAVRRATAVLVLYAGARVLFT